MSKQSWQLSCDRPTMHLERSEILEKSWKEVESACAAITLHNVMYDEYFNLCRPKTNREFMYAPAVQSGALEGLRPHSEPALFRICPYTCM